MTGPTKRSSKWAWLLCAGLLGAPAAARADGPEGDYGAPGPYGGQPEYSQEGQQPGSGYYQPSPEGVCYDEDNQSYDCSQDEDYASYGQLDDGYDQTAYQDFQDALSPYGSWVDTPQYGQVWVPSTSVVGYDFTPYYSNGHFSYTDYGWTWVSDWDWGWAPFHYGRWMNIGAYGWSWIPGRIWGPSWVHWRHGGGYVGWTPLPPRGVRIAPPMGARAGRWNFVPAPQLGGARLVRVAPGMVPGLYGRTASMNVLRSIGAARVNIGPAPGTLSLNVTPAPLRGLQIALPRAHVVTRPGMPVVSRPYLAPGFRGGVQAGVFGRPPGQAPVFNAPVYGRPGFQPAPGYQRPGFQAPAPTYQRPAYQAPTYQAPTYQRPAYQAPTYQRPTYQAPTYQAPTYQRPAYQAPAPTYQRPTYQAPTYQAPTYQRPSFQPAPTYQAPTYQRPSFQSAPSYRPAPTFSAPSRPSYSAPTFHAPAAAPARSYSAPSHFGGGHHR